MPVSKVSECVWATALCAKRGNKVVSSCGCEVIQKESTVRPSMLLRDMEKSYELTEKTTCDHRKQCGNDFALKHGLFSPLLPLLMPSQNGRRSVTSFLPPSFLHEAQSQFGNHITTTCGNLCVTFFGYFVDEPCTPLFFSKQSAS